MSLAALAIAAAVAVAVPVQQDPGAEAAHLAALRDRTGVVALPGVFYELLKSGPVGGGSPNRADTISVRYTGRFLDGHVFNTSPDDGKGVATFELNKLIPGWVGALRLMRPGDEWRLTIPAWLAYGAQGKAEYIPPNATLIFNVELVGVAPAKPEPKP